MYSSTGFGRPLAHHQELNNCSSNLWFYRWSMVVAVLLVVVGPAGRPARPRPTPRSNGKIRGCNCSCWAPDDGREDARNMLSCTYEWTSSNKLEKLLHLVGWFIWKEKSTEYSFPSKTRNVPDDLLNHELFKATLMYEAGWLFGPLISWLVGLLIDWLDDYSVCLLIQSTSFDCIN